ncbi:MAG: hypothetical protein WCW63_05530 [Acholeplasmataceae bacterium]
MATATMVTIASISCTRTREDVDCLLNKSAKKVGTTIQDNLAACLKCPHAEIIWTTQGIDRRKNGLKTVFDHMNLEEF